MVWLKYIVVLGLLAGCGLIVISWNTARDHAAPVRFPVGPPPDDFPVPLADISFRTSDGLTLSGWYGEVPDSRGTAILLHRYQAGRTFMISRARWYAEAGFSVLLYDARATGESEGDRISLGYHETRDLTAALHWIRARTTSPIVCHGVSQGGATIVLAADRLGDIAAVVIESTYDTLSNAGDRRFRNKVGLPGWLAGVFYRPFIEIHMDLRTSDVRPIDHIGSLAAPVFILSGANDRHTWASDTIRLCEAATEPKACWIVPHAAHEDLYAVAPVAYEEQLGAFLTTHVDAWRSRP